MEGPSTGIPSASPSGLDDTCRRAGRLARLAHFTTRYRWPVIAAWIVLTLFGGYAAGQLSTRWYQSLAVPGQAGLRGEPADAQGARSGRPVAEHRRLPLRAASTSARAPAVRAAMARVAKATPGALTSSYFSTGNSMYVSQRPAHDVPAGLSARPGRARREERRREDSRRSGSRASGRDQRRRDGARRARRSKRRGLERRVERPAWKR